MSRQRGLLYAGLALVAVGAAGMLWTLAVGVGWHTGPSSMSLRPGAWIRDQVAGRPGRIDRPGPGSPIVIPVRPEHGCGGTLEVPADTPVRFLVIDGESGRVAFSIPALGVQAVRGGLSLPVEITPGEYRTECRRGGPVSPTIGGSLRSR